MSRLSTHRRRPSLTGALALTFVLALGLTLAAAADAKKKGKAGGTVTVTKAVNAPIPDETAGGTFGQLTSTISVRGRKFKGMRVRDVNATFQTTGNSPDAAGDLIIVLTAPNGTTTMLFGFPGGGRSIGPLTLDDESVNAIQLTSTPGPSEPARDSTLLADPWAGTAQPYCYQAIGGCPLALLDNGPASGNWTLTALDEDNLPGNTSTLNFWKLRITAGRAYAAK